MRRITRPPALNAKMYRHFAAATLLITGMLALFVDNGSTSASAREDQIERKLDKVDRVIEQDNRARRIKAAISPQVKGSWGSDSSTGPVTLVDGGGFIPPSLSLADIGIGSALKGLPGGGPPPGMTLEEWLAELERRKKMGQEIDVSGKVSAANDVQSLVNASRLRAGAGNE